MITLYYFFFINLHHESIPTLLYDFYLEKQVLLDKFDIRSARFTCYFLRCAEKPGLPPTRFTLHHLRHTFATLMLQQNKENVDLRTLQELLGHKSITSTQVYIICFRILVRLNVLIAMNLYVFYLS